MRRAILCALRAQKKEVLKVLLTSGTAMFMAAGYLQLLLVPPFQWTRDKIIHADVQSSNTNCVAMASRPDILARVSISIRGKGADANWHDKDGRSLLWTAADENLTEIAELLLEAGADKDLEG